jgi:hypothetical protein
MKEKEVERMMDQLKAEYIEDALPAGEPLLSGQAKRKRRRWIWSGAAAAAAGLLCLGIYQGRNRAGGPPGQTETVLTGAAQSGETEGQTAGLPSAEAEAKTDYSVYFQNPSTDRMEADYTLEAGGGRYEYERAEAEAQLGFDAARFASVEATVFCDSQERPENLLVCLADESSGKYLSLTVSESGNLFSCYPIEESGGMDYRGTPVYGFQYTPPLSDSLSLELYFRKDGAGYMLSSTGLSYEEMGAVMESVFASGLRPSSYDLSRGTECRRTLESLSFSRARELSSFAGNIPTLKKVAGMSLEEGCRYFVEYRGGQVELETLEMSYSNDSSYLFVSYRTDLDANEPENRIAAGDVTRASVAKAGSENDDPEQLWYRFAIDYGTYGIEITARCSENMLWEYLEELEGIDGR